MMRLDELKDAFANTAGDSFMYVYPRDDQDIQTFNRLHANFKSTDTVAPCAW